MQKAPVALITGANSGLGLACAEALARKGYRTYATYRNPRKSGHLWSLAANLPLFPIVMDVNRTPSVEKAVRQVIRKEGKIDALLNNAGFVVAGFWEDLSDAETKSQFNTNVFGVLRVVRAVLPHMRRQGSGKILNVGSIGGYLALPVLGPYSASKSAVNSITEALRMETRSFGVEVSELVMSEIKTSVVDNTRRGGKVYSSKSPYRAFTESFEKFSLERFKKAAPVEKAVKSVLQAFQDKHMRRRYLVKFEDKALYFLKRFIPDGILEAAIAVQFPWCKRP